ncbi:MAG: cupin domain-containing protein [Hyphomonadaceae bacterium]
MTPPAWRDDPLAFLIGAARARDFFASCYEREALIVAHEEPQRFSGLLSFDAVDRLIAGTDLRSGQVDLADAARPVDRSVYVGADGMIDRGVIARRYQMGATIIVQQMHEYDPTLGAFCRAMEHLFSAHVQTNVYMTPPSAQGFRTHYDNHDVFVLQVSGEKHWRLYDMPVQTPYRGEGFQGAEPKGELRQEFVLKAGDCAYVPRGMMHDAQTAGQAPSLHITVGLIVKTWADLMLEAVSEVALVHPGFRQSLPPGFAQRGFDRAAAQAHFAALAHTLGAHVKLDNALDVMIDAFIRSRAPDNSGALADAPRPLRADDRFLARPSTPWRLADDAARVLLIAPGGDIAFKTEERMALERALNGTPFTCADLGESGEEMIRRLQAFGLIVRDG